jgi:hypothetical protein
MPEEILETPQPRPKDDRPLDGIQPTNWPKIILAAVLGFGLLAGAAYAGYWYGTQEISKLKTQISNLQLQTQDQEELTPEQTPTPTPIPVSMLAPLTEEETKSWKTYKSTTYGFEFKYPERLQVREDIYIGTDTGVTDIEGGYVGEGYIYCLGFEKDAGIGSLLIPQSLAKSLSCPLDEGFSGVSVDFEYGSELGFAFTSGYRMENGQVIIKFGGEKYGGEGKIPQQLSKQIYINPNGVEVVVVEGADLEAPQIMPRSGSLGALINIKHKVLTGLAIVYDKTTSLLSEDEFYQILSTFKFLN